MYAINRCSDLPDSLNHAVYCRFFNLQEKQLVVAAKNHLRVYQLNKAVHTLRPDGQIHTGTRLECMLQCSVFGNILCLDKAYIAGTARDTLVLGIEDAKLSLVQYDPDCHKLRSVSLHCFEDEVLKCGRVRHLPPPIVCSDPENRCCAMLVYGRQLAIVPLLKDTMFEDEAASPTTGSADHIALQSYTIPVENIEERLQNVADMCFLYGYYEPTLLILYEPNQTTAGRVAFRQDTFQIIAVSLNVKERVHAVIWNVSLLPFDCFRALPVPKPVGGLLVFAANSAIYLNQSVPPYGVSLNSNGREATQFPMRNQEDKQITLDGCHADFLNPKTLVLSLRSGDLYVLTLLVDNMSAVKSMHFDRAASSVITTSLCRCEPGFIFLASHLANSLLLRYWDRSEFAVRVETVEETAAESGGPSAVISTPVTSTPVTSTPVASKRSRLTTDGQSETHEEDVDIYGEVVAVRTEELMKVVQYGFEVCDSLLNLGPIREMCVGEPAHLSEEFQRNADPVVDVVCATGHAKNGSLSILQRSVRPVLITSSNIPHARQLWTVGTVKVAAEDAEEGLIQGAQKYLLISKEVDTMVLEMRGEISELETSGFEMNQRTVACGDLGDGEYMVQVTPMHVFLLRELQRLQELVLDTNFPVCQASIVDPYVVLLTDNGEIMLVTLVDEDEMNGVPRHLVLNRPALHQTITATAVCAYKDVSGKFTLTKEDFAAAPILPAFAGDSKMFFRGSGSIGTPSAMTPVFKEAKFTNDDDVQLYGMTTRSTNRSMKHEHTKQEADSRLSSGNDIYDTTAEDDMATAEEPLADVSEAVVDVTYWVVVCRENGMMEILSLPDFRLVYMVKRFSQGLNVLYDTDPIKLALEVDKIEEKYPPVKEVLLVGLGANKARPHLLAIADEELIIYEPFSYVEGIAEHLAIRFCKLDHSVVLRNHKLIKPARRRSEHSSGLTGPVFHYFDNVAGYSGIFLAGIYPYWIFVTPQGILRCHPMHIDSTVFSFAPFHNINCFQGFIYLNGHREMRISQLPAHVNYDASFPTHKVTLKATVHNVVYLLESKTFAVALSTRRINKKLVSLVGDEKQFDEVEKPDQPYFIYPQQDFFHVQLYSPETWDPVPGAKIDMEDFEHVTTVKEIQLNSEGTVSGYQNYLAMGTLYNYGEDVTVRGRVLICEVVEVVPEPGQPLTKHKVKVLYNKEQKGPVTSLCSVVGYLLTGMGQKIYIWTFKDNDLVGISFLDMQFYIHRLVALRNIVVAGDVFKSISLLRYQEGCKALSIASRDSRDLEVLAIEYLVDNKQLAFLVSDQLENLFVYTYHPEAKESCGGTRLLRRGDFHLGARVNTFYRMRSHIGDPVVEFKNQAANRHVVFYGTLDGGFGFVLPLSEKTYRRLFMLQNVLQVFLPHHAGLNPRAFRAVRFAEPQLQNAQKNVLDGDLCWKYMHLSVPEKVEVAKRIGTSREQLLDDLLEIQRMTTPY